MAVSGGHEGVVVVGVSSDGISFGDFYHRGGGCEEGHETDEGEEEGGVEHDDDSGGEDEDSKDNGEEI